MTASCQLKVNKIKPRGEFSLPSCIPVYSPEDPARSETHTHKAGLGNRSEASNAPLGNRALCKLLGTQDSIQKQEMPSPRFSHGSGRRPWRILINLLAPEKQLPRLQTHAF